MKKTIFILTVLLLIPTLVMAQGQGQGNGAQQQLRDPSTEVTPQGNQYQNQNQVQNAGNETQVQYQAQEAQANDIKGGVNRSETARAKMSAVAIKVQELLNDPELEGGIGPQIREFAQNQKQVQTDLENNQSKLQNRSQIARVLFGPDYKAIKNLKTLQERNQVRIQTLTKLLSQVQNESETTQIQQMIELLMAQDVALQDQINLEEAQPGLLGWFFRLLTN